MKNRKQKNHCGWGTWCCMCTLLQEKRNKWNPIMPIMGCLENHLAKPKIKLVQNWMGLDLSNLSIIILEPVLLKTSLWQCQIKN